MARSDFEPRSGALHDGLEDWERARPVHPDSGTFLPKMIRFFVIAIISAIAIALIMKREQWSGALMDSVVQKATVVASGDNDAGVEMRDGGGIVVHRGRGNHFWMEAEVSGKLVRFMIDTGASHVILASEDARRLGFDLREEDYTLEYATAGGKIRGAPVELDYLSYGPLEMWGLPASVTNSELQVSVAGQTFLDSLNGYEVRGDEMILWP
ncbi:MAG: TIGR02281 family clan AA aspartic protease [Sphingomonadales bacterium]|nr:TIGR02281 family clan AA aspartic protease [Sphingomonadales bacterium]